MPSNLGTAFVVRERVEALEEKLESILDAKGLQEFSRAHAKTALDSTVEEGKKVIAQELNSAVKILEESRIEFDTEAASIQKEIHINHEEFISKMHEIADKMKKTLYTASVSAFIVLVVEVLLIWFTN